MKMYTTIAWFLLLGGASAQAQNGSPPTAPASRTEQQKAAPESPAADRQTQTKIDPAKATDIRQLMDVTGTKAAMVQMMDTMGDSIKPLMVRSLPPGDYRQKLIDLFFAKFKSKADMQQLLDSILPLYDKYFSDEEIKSLIQFYQTPLGQKTAKVMPKLMAESQALGSKWGETLGRESMIEVLSEHPELEKAMEDAKKAAVPQ
jgi:hypothetical protein